MSSQQVEQQAETARPQPFTIAIPDEALEDLKTRLRMTKWAPELANDDWRYGVNGAYLRELVDYWRDGYDWRASEARMNSYDHYRVSIQGTPIHFMRVPSPVPNAKPLLLCHGWPWTFWDFQRVVGPLTDPAAYGGDPQDAFEVIVPSIPGYTFSTPLAKTGFSWYSTADVYAELMRILGFERFAVAGSDWGGLITVQIGHQYGDRLMGIHTTHANRPPFYRQDRPWSLEGRPFGGAAETPWQQNWERKFAAHLAVQMLHAQTFAWAMHDSPVGQAAWLLERRRSWSDCHGDVESVFSKDDLLDTFSLYWLTDSFGSSIRLYAEAPYVEFTPHHTTLPAVTVPTGLSFMARDIPPLREETARELFNVRFYRVHESGGHFAHFEVPETMVTDIRDTFRGLD